MNLSTRLFFWINGWQGRNRWLDAFGRAGAEWVIVAMLFWFVFGTFAQLFPNTHAIVVQLTCFFAAWCVGYGINFGIGKLVHKDRPFVALLGVKKMFQPIGTKSFPSDHAMSSWLLFFVAFIFTIPGFEALFPLALWVSFGRVYAGVHYPDDIIAGMIVSVFVSLVLLNLLIAFY